MRRHLAIALAATGVSLALVGAGCARSSGDATTVVADPTSTTVTTTAAEPAPSAPPTTTTQGSPPTVAMAEPTGRYRDSVFTAAQTSTEKNIVFGNAPDLVTQQPVDLSLDVYQPDPAVDPQPTGRPAIVWVYGGSFQVGSKETVGDVATDWARKGYVTVAPQYRLDKGNTCGDLGAAGADPARCGRSVTAAQHDVQAAVRWIRANADDLGVDPTRIAVGGFSAGAITAAHLAYQADDPGTSGNPGYDSSVRAALLASGCESKTSEIGPGDAPISAIASHEDRLVPFACVRATVDRARAAGLTAELADYDGSLHARKLYDAHRTDTDAAWSTFLITHLDLP